MSSETSMVAAQCRLQEWAEQIRDCQSRPAGMTVVGWCACHGISKANYYYRLRRVREACLENYLGEVPPQQIVPVAQEILQQEKKNSNVSRTGLDISMKEFSIHIEESSSVPLLAQVLEAVMRHAE